MAQDVEKGGQTKPQEFTAYFITSLLSYMVLQFTLGNYFPSLDGRESPQSGGPDLPWD